MKSGRPGCEAEAPWKSLKISENQIHENPLEINENKFQLNILRHFFKNYKMLKSKKNTV